MAAARMSTETEPLSPDLPAVVAEGERPPETPSPVATIAIVAICLPLPLLIGVGRLIHSVIGWSTPTGFDLIFFFTYLPLFALSICVVEPLVVILNILYTNRALSGAMSPVRLLVCWSALIMHSLVLLWLMTHNRPHS